MSNQLQLLQGNQAVALAAIQAGVSFYGGYPITPSSEVMHTFAQQATKNESLKFIQFEDEIASITSLIGAAMGGAKAMTATSGPGFSLMQEGLGLAYMANLPLLLVDVQRVGPSTGMPTMPAQGDVLQAYHGQHGDYISSVLAPASVAECYEHTIHAVNLAQELKQPVILLSDAYLGHLYETVDLQAMSDILVLPNTMKPFGKGNRHLTGLLHDQGTPKVTDHEYYKQWLHAKKKKTKQVCKKYQFFEYHENKNSNTLVISYGITSRFINHQKQGVAHFRPIRLFPVLSEQLLQVADDYERIVVVEMNDGQYSQIIQQTLARKVNTISLLGGKIDLDYLDNQLKKQLSSDKSN